jgi:hypothetical protein
MKTLLENIVAEHLAQPQAQPGNDFCHYHRALGGHFRQLTHVRDAAGSASRPA